MTLWSFFREQEAAWELAVLAYKIINTVPRDADLTAEEILEIRRDQTYWENEAYRLAKEMRGISGYEK